MIKRFYLILFLNLILLSGCQKKPVQLPLIDYPGISEIQNHSSIWIFMETVNGETLPKLNKNNKILNTHWIFNIDRRLTMSQVVPLLIEMQENRNKDSMHKKEGMKNYFSYADTATQKISLIPFPQTSFITETTNDKNRVMPPCTVIVEIWGEQIKLNNEFLPLNSLPSTLISDYICNPEDELTILLTYDPQTSYQDYLSVKAFLALNEINTASVEYVYTVK